jgi:CYTH domain-containing protein
MLITGGIHDMGHLAGNNRGAFLSVQRNLIGLQDDLRARFLSLANSLSACSSLCNPGCESACHEGHHPDHKQLHDPATCVGQTKTVVLYDRAELDNRAYMGENEFATVLREATRQSPGEAAARYDAVVHLVTAADGAQEFYTTENNEARTETVEQAIALDKAVQDAWLGHPHFTVVGNDAGSFDRKLTRILATVLNILGEPEPVEIERKWLLGSAPDETLLAQAVPVDIEQVYLPSEVDGTERRVRARTHDGHTTYFYTVKESTDDERGRIERESIITAETYRMMATMRAPGTEVIRKRRWCFVDGGQHFELDHLIAPVDAWLLEAELVTVDDTVHLPKTLDVSGEVTDDPAWRNGALARAAARNG